MSAPEAVFVVVYTVLLLAIVAWAWRDDPWDSRS